MSESFAWLKSTWCMKLILSWILFMGPDVLETFYTMIFTIDIFTTEQLIDDTVSAS